MCSGQMEGTLRNWGVGRRGRGQEEEVETNLGSFAFSLEVENHCGGGGKVGLAHGGQWEGELGKGDREEEEEEEGF